MTDFSRHIEQVARRLLGEPNKELSGKNQLRFGSHGSLAVEIAGPKRGTWFDHEQNVGGGVLDLLDHRAGLKNGAALDWLRSEIGLTADAKPEPRRIVATYDYSDEGGRLLFQVVRFAPKDFRQRRPDGKGGWNWKVKGTRMVPFRLPELIQAVAVKARIYIPEGEKDVLALAALGLVATCNPGGAGKWPSHFSEHFHGADVVIIPDNDDAGRNHAALVARSLAPVARSIRILDLPGLPLKGDVSDWLAGGGSVTDLKSLADAAPLHQAEPADDEPPPAGPEDYGDPDSGADVDEPVSPEFSDDGLTLAFSSLHADKLRYVEAWGRWFIWTGTHWRAETTRLVWNLSREVLRDIAVTAPKKGAARITSDKTISAVERLARCDRRHAQTVDVWDADPWLLNTPAGIVDLREGKMRRHRPESHMTKITASAPGGDCPTWKAFLHRAMAGNPDLIGFLQRVAGYALTGSTRDHGLFFAYGTGGNGKGVFINTLTGILGDYATVSPMETFTASNSDKHPTDLAMLRGARLVTSQETEEGRQWAESKIKSLTGGDPITARFMRQDFFTFAPQFKLLIAGNHKPGLKNVDEAMRRRLHLIPFTVTIPASERDPKLPETLKSEWPGILKWAIEGCMEWQRIGLAPPAAVTEATADYLEAEDSFSLWMAEGLKPSAFAFETSADLYASWKKWAESAGEEPGTQKRFTQNFQAKGAIQTRKHGGIRGFDGFQLNRKDYTEEGRYGG